MLTGFKGVKYGLQPGAQPKEKQGKVGPKLSAFADEEEEGASSLSALNTQLARQAAQKGSDAKVARAHAAAVAEDPTVFDYDGVYDSIQQQRVAPKQQEKIARKSRYIEALLEKSKGRNQEQDIIYERKLLKEREVEDYLFGDKDKFVTAAYKRKLQEDKLWLAADRAAEAAEEQADAQRIGHMGNFYKNILTNNEAMGTASKAKEPAAGEAAKGAAQGPVDPGWEAARKARAAYEAAQAGGEGAASQPAAGAGSQAASQAPLGRPSGARAPAAEPGLPAAGAPGPAPEAGVSTGASREAGPASAAEAGGGGEGGSAGGEGLGPAGQEGPPASSVVARSTTEERAAKAAAARDRFLARKRKSMA